MGIETPLKVLILIKSGDTQWHNLQIEMSIL